MPQWPTSQDNKTKYLSENKRPCISIGTVSLPRIGIGTSPLPLYCISIGAVSLYVCILIRYLFLSISMGTVSLCVSSLVWYIHTMSLRFSDWSHLSRCVSIGTVCLCRSVLTLSVSLLYYSIDKLKYPQYSNGNLGISNRKRW